MGVGVVVVVVKGGMGWKPLPPPDSERHSTGSTGDQILKHMYTKVFTLSSVASVRDNTSIRGYYFCLDT